MPFRWEKSVSPLVIKIEMPFPLSDRFQALGIESVTFEHPPVFTVEEGAAFKRLIPGGHTKNLFLKDKKQALWLVTALWDTEIDLKWLALRLNAARLSFGKADILYETLGVRPGSVTPLALLNDGQRRITPVLDARLLACESVNCHPLTNNKTTSLSPENLLRFIRDLGYKPVIVDFARLNKFTGKLS